MGQGSYVICEWDSVQKENPEFQVAFKNLEQQMITKCNAEWAPRRFNKALALTGGEGFYGRTTILPELFDDINGTAMATWRQFFLPAQTGHQTIITGGNAGNTIPEDFKIAWMGLAFPNKEQNISEIRFQIGDRKHGRLDIEEIHSYNKPIMVFDEGFIIDEETSFDLYAYIEGPIPNEAPFITGIYQRVVMIGAAYFKVISKVLGNCGAQIT